MKLRNRKTGEIIEAESCNNTGGYISIYYKEKDGQISTKDCYTSLAKLNEEWEDAPEEPKEYWYIDYDGGILCGESDNSSAEKMMISMGNQFESLEEAELAVRKLKAWKRLKDKGFRFAGYSRYDWDGNESPAIAFEYSDFDKLFDDKQVVADLDLLFLQEEEE